MERNKITIDLEEKKKEEKKTTIRARRGKKARPVERTNGKCAEEVRQKIAA